MCGVIVVDAGRSRSTWHGRDAYIHNHCLGYRHNFALFYQLLDSKLFTHRMFSFKREASSETYGPRVYLPSYIFRFINQKNPKIPCCTLFIFTLVFSFIYILYLSLSLLFVTVKGLTTPFSRCVQVFFSLCRCIDWDLLVPSTGLIPWFLTEANTYLYFSASPFSFQGKN